MGAEERDRLAELRDALDRKMSRRGIPAHRQLFRVYDGGAIPSAVPAMFLTHPVAIDCDETEGATPTLTPDTSQSVPVLVLGTTAPVAGDDLLARVISGRWVAWMQVASTEDVTCGTPCGVCDPPVTLAAVGTVTDSLGTYPLLSGSVLPLFWPDYACDYGTELIPITRPVLDLDPENTTCQTKDETLHYAWGFSCATGDGETWAIRVVLLIPTAIQCPGIVPEGESCTIYYHSNEFGGISIAEAANGLAVSIVGEPTCDGGNLTVTASGYAKYPDSSGCDDQAPYPTTAGTFVIPIEVPRDQTCCSPCPIPNEDLTLTTSTDGTPTGTSTLAYDPDAGTWGDGTVTLSCVDGVANYHDARGDHAVNSFSTCVPYHASLSYPSGGHLYEAAIDE